MADPSHEVQQRVISRLRNYAPLQALVGQRVYDAVPSSGGQVTATFPYISMGPRQVIEDDADCIEGYEVYLQLDAWSRAPGFAEVSAIAQAVRKALRDYDLPLAVNAQVLFEHQFTNFQMDPDGLTRRAIISMRALVDVDDD